ncbi:MAG: flavodoxin domain-containing protein [Candidatus Wenzhouxiangella sp. M2_3B_020]
MSTDTVSILIVHASVDGHTEAIAEKLGRQLERRGLAVRVSPLSRVEDIEPGISGCVFGACVRYGRHDRRLPALIERNATLLSRIPWAVVSVDLTARDPVRRTPARNAYARKLLARLPVRPDHVEILAGRLDYPAMRRIDRWLIRRIMQWTGGPTDPATVVDYTDWDRVEELADLLAGMFGAVDDVAGSTLANPPSRTPSRTSQ